MIVSSVKVDDIFYVLTEKGEVYKQKFYDDDFYRYNMKSKICKKLLIKTIMTMESGSKLHKQDLKNLKDEIEELKLKLRQKSREVRMVKTVMCAKCLIKGKSIREAL